MLGFLYRYNIYIYLNNKKSTELCKIQNRFRKIFSATKILCEEIGDDNGFGPPKP